MKSLIAGTTLAGLALAGVDYQPAANAVDLPDRCNAAGQIALTFDGGPGQATGALLQALDALNVKVAFHISTAHLNQDLVQTFAMAALNLGNVVGLFFNPGQNVDNMTDEEIIEALLEEDAKIHRVLNIHPRFLRLPHGAVDQRLLDIATAMGFIVTGYNFDPQDYQDKTREGLLTKYQEAMEPFNAPYVGRFVTVHHDTTPDDLSPAIEAIVEYAREKGYSFVGLDQCMNQRYPYKSDAAGEGPFLTLAGSTNTGGGTTGTTNNGNVGSGADNSANGTGGNEDDYESSYSDEEETEYDPNANIAVVPQSSSARIQSVLGIVSSCLALLL